MVVLYELVKDSKKCKKRLQELINLFEPKIRKSLTLTDIREREDLAQELKCKIISGVYSYDLESTPGFWELREKYNTKNLS